MNVRFSPALILAALFSPTIALGQCNCSIFPFQPDPPCFDDCAAILVLEADPDRLEAVLDIPLATVRSIEGARSSAVLPKSLDGFSERFSDAEFEYVKEKLRNMSQQDFEYLKESVPSLQDR